MVTDILTEWAIVWGAPPAAIADLRTRYGMAHGRGTADIPHDAKSEAGAQSRIRLEAARKGKYLWRNNVGAGHMQDGSFIRFGLANESKEVNARLKSGDLIGVAPVVITPAHVGSTIGQFLSREVKRPGWSYTGTDREAAQLKWIELINSLGGNACFATAEGTL